MAGSNASKKEFSWIKIQLASPEKIREWSHGEVTKPETINYRSFRPERDGLFCERIFGPERDWECYCGKYKRIRYRGVVCDRCGVEVTQSKVRRERMGHIELAIPVSHIWYFKSIPSRIGALLDLGLRSLERVLYYEAYIVLDPGDAPIEKKDLLTDDEVAELEEKGFQFRADMGAQVIKELLAELDIEELSADLRARVRMETSIQRKQEMLKRLRVVEAFRQSGNRAEWMIMDAIPVIPPELRPLVPLEGGRFATSDLNDLYRRVINRNNRLKKLMEIRAPEVILRNEKRMLQESVDALFDNGRRSRAIQGDGNRPLKSLSDLLKGKQGRFRQNLLGKRVDYSGRSVIVVGPELKLHQCGLPKYMALELFKPFIIKKLEEKDYVQTIKSAKKLVERERPEVWDILEEIVKDHYVLLNRAPTLHRLGIQAFQPILVEGQAIRVHPLVCAAFNADFDGDQMAVHLPLSFEAQIEAQVLMTATNNLLLPANGKAIVADKPQDIALGCYYMTKMRRGGLGSGRRFSNFQEVLLAHDSGRVALHSEILVRLDGQLIETTPGRILFNEILPKGYPFVNDVLDKKEMQAIVSNIHRQFGNQETVRFVDDLKDIGYKYATISGITIALDDVVVPKEKGDLVAKATVEVEQIQRQYTRGIITDGERYNKVIDVWQHTRNDVTEVLFDNLRNDENGFNPLFMMHDSGARGSEDQVSQLGGMRGVMAKPLKKITGGVGELIESPILANFKEGLTVLEYFISTHGARKGLADTALKTAEAGYLTRRMVDVAQDAIIREEDCGTTRGIDVRALKEEERVDESLSERILGRVTLDDVEDPATGEILVSFGEEITEEEAARIEQAGIESVRIRSVLTCEARRGVCVKCYGRNLAMGKLVDIGEAVGVVAAQSIGEPGTQLTLRTFHIGGMSSRIAEQSKVTVKRTGKVRYEEVHYVDQGEKRIVVGRKGEIEVLDSDDIQRARYQVPYGAVLSVKDGQTVVEETTIYEWDPYNNVILTDQEGTARFADIREGVTVREEFDETSGSRQWVITDQQDRTLSPHVEVIDHEGNRVRNYIIPVGARLAIRDGDSLRGGDVLAKIPRASSKTRDITGGLPRVIELLEARRPKEPAVVSEIDGKVRMGGVARGAREIFVLSDDDEERKYLIPYGKHVRVHTGDRVLAGERLSEGSVNPHDVLRIQGPSKVQEYLVNEIQEVYRLNGVRINDKHIEIIVRQMLQKVKVVDSGGTDFLEGDRVDRIHFEDENRKAIQSGGEAATSEPILLGISKVSLMTDSFISAASFQETTRVLTEAAIQGRMDPLLGLKENVIIGHLIPAGTGMSQYREAAYERVEENVVPSEKHMMAEVAAG
ncbi:MAG: DNA-directed RNA polymerase subunit beta' [Candidatus Latescibacterota bacterium]